MYNLVFFRRWAFSTIKAMGSKTAIVIFVVSFVLTEIFWLHFYGFNKAWEQAIENLIPALTGCILTAFAIAITQFFQVRDLIKKEVNDLHLIMAQQSDEAKRVANWLGWHLVNRNV